MGIASVLDVAAPVRKIDIINLPESARLVMLVGPNGSGKSTILRGVRVLANTTPHPVGRVGPIHKAQLTFHGKPPSASKAGLSHDQAGITQLISSLFSSSEQEAVNQPKTAQQLVEEKIAPFASLFGRVFPDITVIPQRKTQQGKDDLVIKKRGATYPWTKLSSGEQRIFSVFMGLLHDHHDSPNRIFFLDEPDANVHSHLQATLLEECFGLLKPSSQLWIATQSIGMIHRAVQYHREYPGQVAFLETSLDFNTQTVLEPVEPDRDFAKRVLRVALHDLADLTVASHIVICEGRPLGTGTPERAEFDAKVLRIIFRRTRPDVDFFSAGGSKEVESDMLKLAATLEKAATGIKTTRLIDRDSKSQAEIDERRKLGIRVLSRCSIENYLWSDEILTKLLNAHALDTEAERIIAAKRPTGAAEDHLEPIKETVRNSLAELKKLPPIRGMGETQEAFAKNVLAPLITPDTATYRDLDRDIFS